MKAGDLFKIGPHFQRRENRILLKQLFQYSRLFSMWGGWDREAHEQLEFAPSNRTMERAA